MSCHSWINRDLLLGLGLSSQVAMFNNHRMDTSNYDRQNSFFRTVDGVPVRKVFVSNLPKNFPDELLRSLFEEFGNVLFTQLCRRQEDAPNMFGFVTFHSPLEAARVIKKRFLRSHGRKIFVSAADGWHQPVELPCGKIIWDTRPNKMKQTDPNVPGGSGEGVEEINESVEVESEESEEVNVDKVEEEDVEVCPVSKLNDDCLLAVFDYLDVKHRAIAGLVCKRWRRIASYFWDSIKQLDFTSPPFHEIPITKGTLSLLLSLCPKVRSINLARDRCPVYSSTLITIAGLCPNLEEIKMRDAHLKDRTLVYLARKCPNLKSFSMDASSSNHDQEMHSFVKNLKQLDKIHLKYTRNGDEGGTWLKHLSSPLKSLKLEVYEFDPIDLIDCLRKNNGCLEELSFVSCTTLGKDDLDFILSLSPRLTNLQVSGSYIYLTPDSLNPVARLKQLTHLDFDSNHVVNDKLIEELVDGCPKLTHLNLSGIVNHIFTSKGLSLVVKFTELSSLRLANLQIVSDQILKVIAKNLKGLKQLDLMNCVSVTDDGCIDILNQCGILDTFDIAGCILVTIETINTAIKLARNNLHKPRLRIIAGGTEIADEAWLFEPDVTRRVLVDLEQNCREKCRLSNPDYPDFGSSFDGSDIDDLFDDCDSDDFLVGFDDDTYDEYDMLDPDDNIVEMLYSDHPYGVFF